MAEPILEVATMNGLPSLGSIWEGWYYVATEATFTHGPTETDWSVEITFRRLEVQPDA